MQRNQQVELVARELLAVLISQYRLFGDRQTFIVIAQAAKILGVNLTVWGIGPSGELLPVPPETIEQLALKIKNPPLPPAPPQQIGLIRRILAGLKIG